MRFSGTKWAIGSLTRCFTTGLGYEASGYTPLALKGKSYFVTGSTDGVGKHSASLLAQAGATVLVHGRNLQKVKKTIRELRTQSANPSVFGYCNDVSTITAVKALAAHVTRDVHQFFGGSLHCLANNAGVFMEDYEATDDGLESTWAVNVMAPWLLSKELLPIINGRIVNCSSISLADDIDMANTQQENGYEREGHASYGTSKLALNMWSYRLATLLTNAGSHVTVNCVDPGTVSTKLLYAGWGDISAGIALRVDEADDEFWAATDPSLDHITGKYFVNRKSRQSSSASYDAEKQQQVWELLEKQTGVIFDVDSILQ